MICKEERLPFFVQIVFYLRNFSPLLFCINASFLVFRCVWTSKCAFHWCVAGCSCSSDFMCPLYAPVPAFRNRSISHYFPKGCLSVDCLRHTHTYWGSSLWPKFIRSNTTRPPGSFVGVVPWARRTVAVSWLWNMSSLNPGVPIQRNKWLWEEVFSLFPVDHSAFTLESEWECFSPFPVPASIWPFPNVRLCKRKFQGQPEFILLQVDALDNNLMSYHHLSLKSNTPIEKPVMNHAW